MNPIDTPVRAQRIQPTSTAWTATADPLVAKSQLWIRRTLCMLFCSLIFEGVARKLAPQLFGIVIFFLKDFLTVVLLLLCLKSNSNSEASHVLGAMRILVLLLCPCIALTALHDPVLAVFGIKQYALFPTVAVAMCLAYLPNHFRELFSFIRLLSFSVIVTTCVAVLQNRLPSSNWLNLSTGGDDLSAFSAAGYLRVSSTFPFVAQYCWYLNAMCYCLPAFFYFSIILRKRGATIRIVVLIGFLIIGTFVTGSRAAVVGNAGILSAAGLLCVFFGGAKALLRMVAFALIGMVLLGVIQSQHPEFFAAYQARVEGTSEASHSIEMEHRIVDGLLGWTRGSAQAPPSLFGYGLGSMSNGSEKLSSYGARMRSIGWTETDQATTFFEGGWYLIFVWYGFRFWVILYSISLVFKMRNLEFRVPACFACGLILILGVVGTLALQPPTAIWWWLAVGLVICLAHFDRVGLAEMTKPLS